MVKRYIFWAFVVFVAGMLTNFVPKLIHQVRLDNAWEEYMEMLSESVDLRFSYIAELEQILMSMKRMKPSEKERLEGELKKRLSELGEEIKKATEKLAKAKKKFCDLAGEKELPCQEGQTPAPSQGQII